MQDWIKIWMIIVEFAALSYLLIMSIINFGWHNTKTFIPSKLNKFEKVSVVIAVRNEAQKIRKLLESLLNQTYPRELFELVIINDNSDDDTVSIIEEFGRNQLDFNIVLINSEGEGKKNALLTGMKQIKNEIIITTDGDCEISSPDWIMNYASFFDKSSAHLVFGPVMYKKSESFLKRIFSLEFASLVSSGAGSSGVGLTLMGNGANLAFKKSSYETVKNKMGGSDFASGDDVFLMHSMASNFGKSAVKFIKSKESLVETDAPDTFNKFINQRLRWGSKAKAYTNLWPILVSLTVFVFSFVLVTTALLSFYESWFLAVYVLFILLKFLLDYPIIKGFMKYFHRNNSALLLLVLEFVYPFYILYTALAAIFIPFGWKGRKKIK